MASPSILPVILSGGSGSRLWPLSRSLYPKQLLPLVSERPLIVETAQRVAGDGFQSPVVVCNDVHRFIIAEQLRDAGSAPASIILEPAGRNTAPAAALAALAAMQEAADVLLLVLPSDHAITKPDAFMAAIAAATPAAAAGQLVTFGITPDGPETGYGYIRQGAVLADAPGVHTVEAFVEKPNRDTAQGYLDTGGYLWNSGMFLFRADVFIDELGRFAPDVVAACQAAVAGGQEDLDFQRPDAAAFEASPSIAIDVAVMEKTDKAAVVPVDMGWSDVGSFAALWREGPTDADGNVAVGDVLARETSNSYLRTDGPLLAVHGLDNVVIVATADAVLAVPKDAAEQVKGLVEAIAAEGRDEHAEHLRVHRPWGWYQGIDLGTGFQVKRLYVKPGARLSLQSHVHRAEHWVVVGGTATVTRGDEVMTLTTNQSTYIPAGTRHRLENPGTEPLYVVEVQTGDYLGEDDIQRYEDDFKRD